MSEGDGWRSLGLILIDASLAASSYRMPPFHCTISHQNVWIETDMWAGSYFDRQQMLDQILVRFDSNIFTDYGPYLDPAIDVSSQIMSWFQNTPTPERGAYVQGTCDLVTQIVSWVNGAKTVCHGSHVDGALQAVEAIDWPPVLVLIHIVMHDPAWAGPTRSQLDAPHITEIVKEALREPLQQYQQEYLEPWKQGER
ncbi:MAG: hypothetical protein F6K09_13710 [Merismopedia sp. SIO2A8]|nr:hypothetical protein [Merismopedia sp. SIO2A8]